MPCGRILCRNGKPCRRCARDAAQERAAEAVTWFERTEHCHGCGQPGGFCLCTVARPCLCRDLHPMGSGQRPGIDAADVFAVPADDNQQELF